MNKVKKIIYTLTIAFIFMVSLDTKALTLGTTKGTTDPNSYIVTDKATLTINNVSADDTFRTYKILDVFYNETSNAVTYEFTSEFKTFLDQESTYKDLTIDEYLKLTSGDITSGSTKTSSTLDKLVSRYARYIIIKYENESLQLGQEISVTGTTISSKLEAGSYLVLPFEAERVYAVMVGNLTPTVENNIWVIKDFTINAKVSDAYINMYIGDKQETSGSYNMGEKIKITTIATLPLFPTNMEVIYSLIMFTIPLEKLDESDSVIKVGDTIITKSGTKLLDQAGNEIGWVTNTNTGETALFFSNAYLVSNKITIEFYVTLNEEDNNIGDEGNEYASAVIYTSKYYEADPTAAKAASVTIYTYGIDLLAYKKGDSTTTLSDMTFEVYKDADLTEKLGTITTDSSGKGTLAGVAEGTYYIKNTKTKSGYNLAPTTAMKVKISGSVASTTTGYYKVEIEVPEAGLLPFTGGAGTLIYTAIGIIIISISMILFVSYSKKSN